LPRRERCERVKPSLYIRTSGKKFGLEAENVSWESIKEREKREREEGEEGEIGRRKIR